MSALSDLVYGKDNRPWSYFTDKYPVKVKQITGLDNDQLERDIKDAGDHLGGRTPAKCLMTRWDMHVFYQSFVCVIISLNQTFNISLTINYLVQNFHYGFLFPKRWNWNFQPLDLG